MTPLRRQRAAIVGLAGTALTAPEAETWRDTPPVGAILFSRNIVDPDQLRGLIADIRGELGEGAPVLVDQEGGRVARLRAPHWPEFPAPAAFADLPREDSEDAARANAALLGLACREVGFDVVCAPVLDLRLPGQDAIIGDRSFGPDPAEVARLGRAWVQGLQEAGCVPVVKHIPGHGRAAADSHLELPVVTASRDELAEDCAPFAALADSGAWAMTAHILYEALDVELPATLSETVISRVIRHAIGFNGVLVSDDLCMKALRGDPAGLAQQALAAGCDLVLHCNGDPAETAAVLDGCPVLSSVAEQRLHAAKARVVEMQRPLDAAALRAARDAGFGTAAA
ncbi:MAG: beta-N-acetylhexosaminidase [Acetobacteraceae bacterium]|nr:beta-N-acetylhexosaminidase [Acetobacteraceae bacterium]